MVERPAATTLAQVPSRAFTQPERRPSGHVARRSIDHQAVPSVAGRRHARRVRVAPRADRRGLRRRGGVLRQQRLRRVLVGRREPRDRWRWWRFRRAVRPRLAGWAPRCTGPGSRSGRWRVLAGDHHPPSAAIAAAGRAALTTCGAPRRAGADGRSPWRPLAGLPTWFLGALRPHRRRPGRPEVGARELSGDVGGPAGHRDAALHHHRSGVGHAEHVRARPRASICCSPPDRFPAGWSARPASGGNRRRWRRTEAAAHRLVVDRSREAARPHGRVSGCRCRS